MFPFPSNLDVFYLNLIPTCLSIHFISQYCHPAALNHYPELQPLLSERHFGQFEYMTLTRLPFSPWYFSLVKWHRDPVAHSPQSMSNSSNVSVAKVPASSCYARFCEPLPSCHVWDTQSIFHQAVVVPGNQSLKFLNALIRTSYLFECWELLKYITITASSIPFEQFTFQSLRSHFRVTSKLGIKKCIVDPSTQVIVFAGSDYLLFLTKKGKGLENQNLGC